MGLRPFKLSNSVFDIGKTWLGRKLGIEENKEKTPIPNPDPYRYKINNTEIVNGYLMVEIQYLDCTNYEGIKVLVFDKGVTLIALYKQKAIDPHFSNNPNFISPIARFEPTARGWLMARKICEVFNKE